MTKRIAFQFLLSCWLLCNVVGNLSAVEDTIGLSKKAVSLLIRECVSCHGPDKQEANLRLDSHVGLLAGGDSGAVVSLSDAALEVRKPSQILQRIEHLDKALLMPPKRRLAGSDIAILKAWVEAGAAWQTPEPTLAMPESALGTLGDAWSDLKNPIRVLFDGARLNLWSLKPIRRPEIPQVFDTAWCRNPVDCFVLANRERDGRSPAPEASNGVLMRRLSLDMKGVPADFSQVQSFVQDTAQDKYERQIDQNLNSPAFGVHWARMWLDVVRYSDSNGFDWDELRPNAWQFRDYVVRSLNQDETFDRFVEKQLAGDELLDGAPRDPEEQDQLIATGYLRLGPRDNAAGLFNEQDRARAELMTDLTETTASALLGLTMSCCRCHDHKTDPLSHADHYRLRAFFAASHYADDVAIDLKPEQIAIKDHNQVLDTEIKCLQLAIDEKVNAVLGRQPSKVEPKKAKELMTPDERETVEQAESKIKSLKQDKRLLTKGFVMHDKADSVQPTHVLIGGDHRAPKDLVEPGFPSALFPNAPTMIKPAKVSTTGRRLTLARWMSSRENPWTARVIVNRLWQNYFGQGIVATPNDFGMTGALPTHPELLDYLAMELIDSGWSLKHIHRLIVSSSTYRQQSIADAPAEDSRKLATLRNHLRRTSAEQLRDSILSVSGLLQERAGGPPVWPVLDEATLAANPAVLDDNETKTKGWYPSPLSEQSVRSLYLIQKRTIRIPWMETFDLPENAVSCGRRESSLVAPQSLAMMNGSLSLQASKRIADEIAEEPHWHEQQKIEEVFRRILSRGPRQQELASCRLFLDSRSLVELCLVLLNTNEFAFID